MRKRPKWTKAMRAKAAADGRRGGYKGGYRGGLVSWATRTEEQRAAILERLRVGRTLPRRHPNNSPAARLAQSRRARVRRPMTGEKAWFLYTIGVLFGTEVKGPVDKPRPADYKTHEEWARAAADWERKDYQAMLQKLQGGEE